MACSFKFLSRDPVSSCCEEVWSCLRYLSQARGLDMRPGPKRKMRPWLCERQEGCAAAQAALGSEPKWPRATSKPCAHPDGCCSEPEGPLGVLVQVYAYCLGIWVRGTPMFDKPPLHELHQPKDLNALRRHGKISGFGKAFGLYFLAGSRIEAYED